jgi:hypothetical protein
MMKDYYKILGVEEEASEEKIRARWIELVKYHHPDLGRIKGDDERIKEINEAYEVLTDSSKRLDYDLEKIFKRSLIKRARGRKEKRFNFQKIIIPAGLIALCFIVALVVIGLPRVSKPPNSEIESNVIVEKGVLKEVPREILNEIPKENSPAAPPLFIREEADQKEEPTETILPKSEEPSTPLLSQAEKEPKREEELPLPVVMKPEAPVRVEKEVPKEVSKEVPREIPKEVLAKEEPRREEELPPPVVVKPEAPTRVEKEVPKEVSKEVSKEIPKKVLAKEEPKQKEVLVPPVVIKPGAPVKVEKEVPKEVSKEVPKEAPKDLLKEVTKVTLRPGEKIPETWVVSAPAPSFAKEEEVKQFFSNYIDRYHQKDINGFLSFFSPKAVQNQQEGFEKIKENYSDFFARSQEVQYHIEDTKIEIYQNGIEVKARYQLDQLSKGGERKRWRGNIRWVLVREDGNLKISSLDYKIEKTP